MKILYISTAFPPAGTSTIYTDLAEALAERGHEVTVVTGGERRSRAEAALSSERGCRVLRVRTGNMYDVGLIEKGLSVLAMPRLMRRAVRRHLAGAGADLVLFEAPPVTLEGVAAYCARRFHAPSFLMMKDIFPQNAVDIGVMREGGLLHRYFRHRERRLYRAADMIGCMSRGNLEYLSRASGVDGEKLSIFPNTKRVAAPAAGDAPPGAREGVRGEYAIPPDKVVFVFGGNMGRPQGLGFLCRAIIRAEAEAGDAFFVLVGRGTEHRMVEGALAGRRNCLVLGSLPRDEYERLVAACDVGLISLDHRFTVPNYPSRILSYMECSMPVLAATDSSTDFRGLVEDDARCGLWCESRDPGDFVGAVRRLAASPELRRELGRNGRAYLEANFSVERSVELLEEAFERTKSHVGG